MTISSCLEMIIIGLRILILEVTPLFLYHYPELIYLFLEILGFTTECIDFFLLVKIFSEEFIHFIRELLDRFDDRCHEITILD